MTDRAGTSTSRVNGVTVPTARTALIDPNYLTAQDLHAVDSAVELPDVPTTGPSLRSCAGGDLVGYPGNWRLLPQGFGDAVTSMFVLHPLQGSGRGLCEWLNSRKDSGQFPQGRDLLDMPVPVDLVTDEDVDDLLEHVQEGRRILRTATAGILPNVYAGGETTIEGIRKDIRFAAYEARLVGELVRPLDDPVWRAEWSYPFHVAALARRYRISTHPAERKDGLLKLSEGIARTLGVLALSELIAHSGFTRNLRRQFHTGATFGTWLWFVDRLSTLVVRPGFLNSLLCANAEPRDLYWRRSRTSATVRTTPRGSAQPINSNRRSRNSSPMWCRLSAQSAGFPAHTGTGVERCEYLGESSYNIVGLRLRGSHPSWEPFERARTFPFTPDRIYVDITPSGTPRDLWPLAAVSLCQECQTRELFLFNQVQDGHLVLCSLEEHSLEIPYVTSQTP